MSAGELASLNCGLGSGDDPALIAENRRRVAEAVLPGATLTVPDRWGAVSAAVAQALFDASLLCLQQRFAQVLPARGRFEADGSYVLELPYADDRELVGDILRHGAACEVLAPPELRHKVAEALRLAVRSYAQD